MSCLFLASSALPWCKYFECLWWIDGMHLCKPRALSPLRSLCNMRKERSGHSTLGLRRWMAWCRQFSVEAGIANLWWSISAHCNWSETRCWLVTVSSADSWWSVADRSQQGCKIPKPKCWWSQLQVTYLLLVNELAVTDQQLLENHCHPSAIKISWS